MIIRQVIVCEPVQKTDAAHLGIAPQKYFKVKIQTEEFGVIQTTIWERHSPDIFEQLLYATDGLDWLDFPRIVNVRVDGIVIRITP